MKSGTISRWRAAAVALGLVAAAGAAAAQGCDTRSPQIQFARDNLQRALTEADVPTAHDYADRARREFEHLAGVAERCACAAARARFEEAARLIRPVQDRETRREVREIVAGVRPVFAAAVEELRACAR